MYLDFGLRFAAPDSHRQGFQRQIDKCAAALLGNLPEAERLLADRGQGADWFKDALNDKGIKPCIPETTSRGKPIKHGKRR